MQLYHISSPTVSAWPAAHPILTSRAVRRNLLLQLQFWGITDGSAENVLDEIGELVESWESRNPVEDDDVPPIAKSEGDLPRYRRQGYRGSPTSNGVAGVDEGCRSRVGGYLRSPGFERRQEVFSEIEAPQAGEAGELTRYIRKEDVCTMPST
jgi:hypothetical protein